MRYVPPHPPRRPRPVATWRGFVGERARTAVYGWSQYAFETDHIYRRVLGYDVHVLLTPESVRHVLLDAIDDYPKPELVDRLLGPVIGEGLLTARGERWKMQRRIVASTFTPRAVEALRPMFEQAARRTSKGWRDGAVHDLAADATQTTMLVIALALFGGDERLVSEEAMTHIAAALAGFGQPRMQVLLRLPIVPIGATARAGARGQAFLRRTLERVVEDHMEGRAPADDFLGQVIDALQRDFDPDDARRLAVDNAATFYLAGHETTANLLGWASFLLSEQPELQEALAKEAIYARAAPDWDERPIVEQLPRLHAMLQETLRLYPPVPRMDRQARVGDELNGQKIAKGAIVSVWPWLLHRHRKFWDDPDAFRADRFLEDPSPDRFVYLPFGAGPRICVGARFSMVEAMSLLSRWLTEWRFVSIGAGVRTGGLVTLRPTPGVRLRLERR